MCVGVWNLMIRVCIVLSLQVLNVTVCGVSQGFHKRNTCNKKSHLNCTWFKMDNKNDNKIVAKCMRF